MKVPVSWLREYVDLPDLDAERLENAFVRVGLEVERITALGSTVEGPLVVGRVQEIEELTGLKKPIRYCRVEVGDSEPAGIICGASNFAVGDLVAVARPGAVLPGGFAIGARKTYGRMSEGMICSARELGIGDDHTGILVLAVDAEPASTPGRSSASTTRSWNSPSRRTAATACRCAGSRASCRTRWASRSATPAAVDGVATGTACAAYDVTVEDPPAATGSPRGRARRRPDGAEPGWMRGGCSPPAIRSISLAVDITNYLMLELGQPMHAFDLAALRGPLVVRALAAGERLTTLDGVAARSTRGHGDLRRHRPISLAAVMGGETPEVGRPLWTCCSRRRTGTRSWWPAPPAGTSCPARRRSGGSAGVDRELTLPSRAGGAAARRVRRRHASTTVLDSTRGRPSRRSPSTPTCRPGWPGCRTARAGADMLREIGCAVDRAAAADGDAADLAARPHRPGRPGRGGHPAGRVRPDPELLPIAPPGNGLTATQRRRRAVGRALAEAGLRRGADYPFVGEAAWTRSASRRRPAPARRAAANPLSEEEPALRTTLLPPLLGALRRNLGRGHRDLALFEIGLVFRPAAATAAAPRCGSTAGRRRRTGRRRDARAGPAVARRGGARRRGRAGRLVGRGPPGDWADAVDAARRVAAAGADRSVRPAATRRGTRAGARELSVGGAVVGHAGELHPAVCAALDLPPRTCAMELSLDALPLPGVTPRRRSRATRRR
jgi:phenylalanyl-tRNA synthetase beta chain